MITKIFVKKKKFLAQKALTSGMSVGLYQLDDRILIKY